MVNVKMVNIKFEGQSFELKDGDSVLETLEDAGFDIPYSCRSGLCHSCMMQADSPPPKDAQEGLSGNQKRQQLFLACSCFPEQDLAVQLIGDSNKFHATVISKQMLNQQVLQLVLESEIKWTAGQYLTLWKNETQGRPYSIASRYKRYGAIEFHIKRYADGQLSPWLHDQLQVGDNLLIGEALGHCFYNPCDVDKPLLLAATGTGLAPLYGIVRDALGHKHHAPILLYSAGGSPEDLYLVEELRQLAEQHHNFYYHPLVRRQPQGDGQSGDQRGYQSGDLIEILAQEQPQLRGWKIFVCGSPAVVRQLQKQCFMSGAGAQDILVDAFERGDSPELAR